MHSRKKMNPPKHAQYQRFHSFGARDWAASTVGPCVCRNDRTDGGTFDSAVSWAAYGCSGSSWDWTATTFSMSALWAWMLNRMFTPLLPPPAAATAWLSSRGGILAGLLYVASLVNRAGCACSTANSGARLCSMRSWGLYFCAVAMIAGWLCANAISLEYRVA